MSNNFQPVQFLKDYRRWHRVPFLFSETDVDAIEDVRYDLYEIDASLAGCFITFVESDFHNISREISDTYLTSNLDRLTYLREHAVVLKGSHREHASVLDQYIERIDELLRLSKNYEAAMFIKGSLDTVITTKD